MGQLKEEAAGIPVKEEPGGERAGTQMEDSAWEKADWLWSSCPL